MTEERTEKVPTLISFQVVFPVKDETEAYGMRKAMLDLLANIPNSKVEMSLITHPAGVTTPNKADFLKMIKEQAELRSNRR